VGSSTGGFTDFALRSGARRVIAVDVGSNQMHPSLRNDPRIELHEKTDIRTFAKPKAAIDIALIDVSFISLREVLPAIVKLVRPGGEIVAMVKPQFEAGKRDVNKGVIKNDKIRRKILHDFESWSKKQFVIKAKADSGVAGAKGNRERFYLLHIF
jgi:23S rRNA (cytidine1920-2'-O)/16S rRNA (cytidine1409-2'-O)-methyltransferase